MPRLTVKGVDIFNEGSAVAIVRYIHEKGEARASELKAVSGNYDRLKLLTERMEELGVLNIKVEEKPRRTFTYTLTKKGKVIAEKLIEIDEIIGDFNRHF